MSSGLAEELEKYCVFRHGGSVFALPANSVVEVSGSPVMVPIPDSDPVLAGVAHLRNEFLPVIELLALAGEPGADEAVERQLLVVKGTNGPWALLIDRVLGLDFLDISNNHDVYQADDWTSAVVGSATFRTEVTRILEPRTLYQLAESVLQRSWQPDPATSP